MGNCRLRKEITGSDIIYYNYGIAFDRLETGKCLKNNMAYFY